MIRKFLNLFKRKKCSKNENPYYPHDWEKWSEPYQIVKHSLYWFQSRKCKICNLKQEKIIY